MIMQNRSAVSFWLIYTIRTEDNWLNDGTLLIFELRGEN